MKTIIIILSIFFEMHLYAENRINSKEEIEFLFHKMLFEKQNNQFTEREKFLDILWESANEILTDARECAQFDDARFYCDGPEETYYINTIYIKRNLGKAYFVTKPKPLN